ncbi:MAG: hypothetical protein K9K66_05130 [Desulfarculaceae bacterium]|nr:hypothetical protein [Desulfarculaceae bacterium]MCF8072856.1 hypothetical protein [Desulfarculaceae bacterium]MCF8101024.1 hypothetical protein [Desulfarculaceae bacterium]MCF8115589.1 hypothetical protein [Desulfarculaceae bacterium]
MSTVAERNFACPNYDACLNEAVEDKRRGFHCEGCPKQSMVRDDWPLIQQQDVQRVVTLFEAVCRRQSRTSSKPLTPEDLAFLWEEEQPGQEACA